MEFSSSGKPSSLFGGDDDDNSQPNIDGLAERATTDRSVANTWEQERTNGRAGAGLRRWSKG
jgi:hypothetical protein